MTKLEILKKVQEEINKLKEEDNNLFEIKEEYNVLNDKIEENHSFNLAYCKEFNLTDLFIIDLYVKFKLKDPSTNFIGFYVKMFDLENIIESNLIDELSEDIDTIYEKYGIKILKELKNNVSRIAILREKNLVNTIESEMILPLISADAQTLCEACNSDPKAVEIMIDLYMNNIEELGIAISKINAFIEMKMVNKQVDEDINSGELKIREKHKRKLIKLYENDNIKRKKLEQDTKQIINYRNDLRKHIEQEEKNRNKQLKNLNKFIELFEKETEKEEITNYQGLIKLIKDEKLRIEVLKYIYNHNIEEYKDIDKELKIYSEDEKLKYQTLLSENNIGKGSYDINLVMNNSYEDLKNILSILKDKKITEYEYIIYVIENSNINIINTIKEYINKNYLRIEDIKENVEITSTNNELLNKISELIIKIKEYNINPSIFVNEENNLLLEDNNIIINNLKVLEEYNLVKNIRNSSNYNFLLNENLNVSLDEIIELGIFKFIEEDLNILNCINTKIIRVYQRLGYSIDSIEDLYEVINSNFINEENVDNYLSKYEEDCKELLDENGEKYNYELSNNNLNYEEYNNIKISKNRIKRNCEELRFKDVSEEEKIFVVLTNGLSIEKDEYNELKKQIKGNVETR